jgi:hypothetical protein
MHGLLDGLRGRAAAVARVALIPFVAFYVPYLAFEGFAVGALGQELNGLPAAGDDRAPVLRAASWTVLSRRGRRAYGQKHVIRLGARPAVG